MINKNFNSISQFSVPQEWIDGALSVPQNEKRNKPVIFVKFSRTFAAVASLVIVCSISLLLFFLTEENAVPPVREPDDSTSSFTETVTDNRDDETNSNEIIIKPTIKDFVNLFGDETVLPTQKPSSTKPTKPTDQPSEDSPPLIEPTEQPPTDAPTEDVPPPPDDDPTEAPTYEPTDAPTEVPWDPPPPWVEPTESPTSAPTEPIDFDSIGIHGRVDTAKLTGSKKVYCKLYNPQGLLMGDSNLFASSHLATKGITDPSITVVHYYPYRNMDITVSGIYTYVFYNENGDELKRGSIYLEANVY